MAIQVLPRSYRPLSLLCYPTSSCWCQNKPVLHGSHAQIFMRGAYMPSRRAYAWWVFKGFIVYVSKEYKNSKIRLILCKLYETSRMLEKLPVQYLWLLGQQFTGLFMNRIWASTDDYTTESWNKNGHVTVITDPNGINTPPFWKPTCSVEFSSTLPETPFPSWISLTTRTSSTHKRAWAKITSNVKMVCIKFYVNAWRIMEGE